MILLKIPIFTDWLVYTQNFIDGCCGLVGLIVVVFAVTIFLYVRKKKGN